MFASNRGFSGLGYLVIPNILDLIYLVYLVMVTEFSSSR